MVPFRRGRFADLPDAPRLPHGYFDAPGQAITVVSRPLGRMKVNVRVHGSGPPLLLVHGLMTSSYSWRYVLEPLGRRFTLHAPDHGSRAFVKHLRETMAVGPIRRFFRELGERKFPVPLLLLYAERDPMVPPRFGELLAERIPEARLVRLAEASHFAHVDAVERFLPPVLDFLA